MSATTSAMSATPTAAARRAAAPAKPLRTAKKSARRSAPMRVQRRVVPPSVTAPALFPEAVPAAAPASAAKLHQLTTVEHQGTVIALAREEVTGAVYYDILDLKVSTDIDDAEWTGYTKLPFPDELRSVGLDIATVPDRDGTVLARADVRIQAVSDNAYVHVFQQSSRGTLLLNRYMYKRVAPSAGGAAVPVLEPAWEVRYQRSGKLDTPDGPKDGLGYTAPDGTPFLEPTLELPMIRNLADGRFAAQLLPDQTGSARRWQFFAVDGVAGKLNTFSYPVDSSGLPDLTGAELDADGNAVPDMSLSLALRSKGTESELTLDGAPTVSLFTLHEKVRATGGDDLLLKRATRDMLAIPVKTVAQERRFATLDFAVGKDGTLARPPARTVATPVTAANYALEFDAGTFLKLPASASLSIATCFRIHSRIYTGSEISDDQFVLSGDPTVAPAQAAPYVKVTKDLRIEFGYGDGTEAVVCATKQPVVKPGQWYEIEVYYDDREPKALAIRVNGSAVPVTHTDADKPPAGQPLAFVAGAAGGFVGVIDSLEVEVLQNNAWTAVGDWPFDTVDYDKPVPTTPDVSGSGNDAQVSGAVLVPSSAPVPGADNQGELYVDERGLSTYAGLLTFAEPAESGTLLTGAGGLVHLYFAGPKIGKQDGLFSVAQYDAQSARAVFESGWTADAGGVKQTGTVTFTAARSGVFMNEARIEVRKAPDAALCEIALTDQHGHAETWRGVPRTLDAFVDVLNGASTDDIADPDFLAGRRVFYDNTGTYATARLKALSHGAAAWFILLSRRPKALQLAQAALSDVDSGIGKLTLEYTVSGWTQTVTQTWRNAPVNLTALASVLNGTSTSYSYADKGSSNATVYGLTTAGPGRPHTVLLIARPGIAEVKAGISDGTKAELCDATFDLGADGGTIVLTDIPRDQNGFADAVNAGATAPYLRAVTDGLTASLPNLASAEPPRMDLRAWTGIVAGFPEQSVAPDAAMAPQTVTASVQQGSTLTVLGVPQTLRGASTLVRALAADRPSDGSSGYVIDNGGPAKLVVAAAGGGWLRTSPHKAIELSGSNYVSYDIKTAASDVLATAGDMTAEVWCRPGTIDYAGLSPTALKRPRLATYYRGTGLEDEIRWTLGLWPRPALNFGNTTEVGYYLPKTPVYPDCSFQITLTPVDTQSSGTVMTFQTTGVVQYYLRMTVDSTQHLAVWYTNGTSPAITSTAALKPGRWTQATLTLRNDNHDANSPVTIALYIDGVLDNKTQLPGSTFTHPPAFFTVGKTSDAFPMRANGTYLWRRTLAADEVALTRAQNPDLEDPDLLIAWPMTEGAGKYLTNRAVSDAGQQSEIVNVARQGWNKFGAYGAPWAANRFFSIASREPVLLGWHHIASSYRSGFSLALAGSQFADCGNDVSLDGTDAFSIEAYFTPANSGTGVDQALVSKTGNYELRVDPKGAVLAAVWTDTLGVVEVRSDQLNYSIESDIPCYAAATVTTGPTIPSSTDKPGVPKYFLHIGLYIDGKLCGSYADDTLEDPVTVQTTARNLNLGRSSFGGAYFSGRLSDVRLWSVALDARTIAETATRREPPTTSGLVSAWRWSEGSGRFCYDQTGLNTAVISANNLWRVYPATSRMALVVDGAEVTDPVYETDLVDELMYGTEQFTVGALTTRSKIEDAFTGALNELRVWNKSRTAEQIREDMYRVLPGDEPGMVGYWEFDTGSGGFALDATGNGNTGKFQPPTNPPKWISGRAPLSNEAKEVYNVLGGQITEFTERITGTPSAAEYADTRMDAYGGLYSVMKRLYGADRHGLARLVSGYTVGELDTVYAGQVQTAPSVVGFIEGAPPMPSENQTNPYWNDPAFWNSYSDDAPTTRITHAETVTRTFKGGTSDEKSFDMSNGLGVLGGTEVSQGIDELVAETDWVVASGEFRVGYASGYKNGHADESELEFGFKKSTTTVDEIATQGDWEDPKHLLNPEVGRRYILENNGYAVVKSLTADMYLDRVRGSNTIVRTVLVPDPDIPEDVNVITFPIDPHYVKNGTLDGMVGFVADPDFPYADVQRGSYFKPVEAYALKRTIERQDKQLAAYYAQFDTKQQYSRVTRTPFEGIEDTGFASFRDRALADEPAYNWATGLSKRAIVNTYVWTAGGGLHTEQTEIADMLSESYTGLSSADNSDGLRASSEFSVFVGLYAELDAMWGRTVEVVSTKAMDSETGFSLDVDFSPERFLKAPVLDPAGQPVGFTEHDIPGKVTGYRFMSFLVPQNAANFTTFTTQVVDQNWLRNSANPDAAALRTATAQPNGVWRVLHRTTYVSRVAPDLQPVPAESTAPPVTEPAGLEGNTLIVRLIDKQLTTPTPSPAQIGAAVQAVLGTGPADPGLLAGLLTWWQPFLQDAQTARSEAASALAALRVDLLAYMIQKYAAQLAQADGAVVQALRSTAATRA